MLQFKAMFGLSFGHIVIVLVIVLLFGAKRLPELGSALGRGLRAFKKGLEGDENAKLENKKDKDEDGA